MMNSMANPLGILLLCLVAGRFVDAGVSQTVIEGLRESIVIGTNARFLVNRADCLAILKERAPGMGLQLASDIQGRDYDTDRYSEVLVASAFIADTTLYMEIDERTSPVSAGGQTLFVVLPVVSRGDVIDLVLATYTDETKPLAIPYFTNNKAVTEVDSITVDYRGYVDVITIRNGGDHIVLRVEHASDCVDDLNVGHDFDDVTGKDIRITNYPAKFDWGCGSGNSFGFCTKLKMALADQALVEGNVCTTMTTAHSTRCPVVSATIEAITGKFLRGLPAPVGDVPIRAIEGEFIDREHNTGIIFPCIVKS